MLRNYVYHPYQFVRQAGGGGGVDAATRLQIKIVVIILLLRICRRRCARRRWKYLIYEIIYENSKILAATPYNDAGDDSLSLCRFSRLSMRNSHRKWFRFIFGLRSMWVWSKKIRVVAAEIFQLRLSAVTLTHESAGGVSGRAVWVHFHFEHAARIRCFANSQLICSTVCLLFPLQCRRQLPRRMTPIPNAYHRNRLAAQIELIWLKTIITITLAIFVLVVKFLNGNLKN